MMPSMAAHDLRRKAGRLNELRRRHRAHEAMTEDEMAELQRGIPAEEMREIVLAIRGERVSAIPSKKVRAAEKAREPVTPIDLTTFMSDENDVPEN